MATNTITSVGGNSHEVYNINGQLSAPSGTTLNITLANSADRINFTNVADVGINVLSVNIYKGVVSFRTIPYSIKKNIGWGSGGVDATLDGVFGIYLYGATLLELVKEDATPYSAAINTDIFPQGKSSYTIAVIGEAGSVFTMNNILTGTSTLFIDVIDSNTVIILNGSNPLFNAPVFIQNDGPSSMAGTVKLEGLNHLGTGNIKVNSGTLDLSALAHYPYNAIEVTVAGRLIPPENQAPVVKTGITLTGNGSLIGATIDVENGTYYGGNITFTSTPANNISLTVSREVRDSYDGSFIRAITEGDFVATASEENKSVYVREVVTNRFGTINAISNAIYIGKIGLYIAPDTTPGGTLLTNTPGTPYASNIVVSPSTNVIQQQGNGSYTLSGIISSTSSTTLTIRNGTGSTLTITGANTYTGGTKIDNNTPVVITKASSLGTGATELISGILTVNNSAFTTGSVSLPTLVVTSGELRLIGSGVANNNLNANIPIVQINTSLKIIRPSGNYGATTINGIFRGNGKLIIGDTNSGVSPDTRANNQGRFIAGSSSAYNEFTGDIQILSAGNLCLTSGQLGNNNVEILTGGYMTVNENMLSVINNLSGGGVITKTSTTTATTLSIASGIFDGRITSTSAIPGNGNIKILKAGPGTLRLNGASNYTGGTDIAGGTLVAGNSAAFGTGPITIRAGATLNKNGFTISNTITNSGGTIIN